MAELALVVGDRGDLDAAADLYREALLLSDGRFDEAEQWGRRAVVGAHHTLPTGHYLTAVFSGRLAVVVTGQGGYAEAENLLLLSLATLEEELGADHPRTVQTRQHLAALYDAWGPGGHAEGLQNPK